MHDIIWQEKKPRSYQNSVFMYPLALWDNANYIKIHTILQVDGIGPNRAKDKHKNFEYNGNKIELK